MLFCGKHDKDATFAYQIVETERTFTYDAAGKLLTATETEDNYGTCVYTFEYDLMGNSTYMEKTLNGTVVEWHRYEYNESNQLISEKLPIVDTQYNYATYYTDPSMPGMIYYSLSQTKRPKYVTAVIKQADEKKEVWWCEPGDTLTKVLNVLTDAMMLEWVGETLIDRVTQSVLPFWVMPEDILDNMLVYPKDYEGIPNSIV